MKAPILAILLFLMLLGGGTAAILMMDSDSSGFSVSKTQAGNEGASESPDQENQSDSNQSELNNAEEDTKENANSGDPSNATLKDSVAPSKANNEPIKIVESAEGKENAPNKEGVNKPTNEKIKLPNGIKLPEGIELPDDIADRIKNALEGRNGSAVKKTPITATVAGTIVDEAEKPIVGATVEVIAPSDGGSAFTYKVNSGDSGDFTSFSGGGNAVSDLSGQSVTDASGEFSFTINGQLRETSESGKISFKISAPVMGGYTTKSVSIRRSGSKHGLKIRLAKRVSVQGRVLNKKDNKPFVGAQVSLDYTGISWQEQRDNVLALHFEAEDVKVGDDGAFVFKDVPGGEMTVSASLPKASGGFSSRIVTRFAGVRGSTAAGASADLSVRNGEQPADITLFLEGEAELLFRLSNPEVSGVKAKLSTQSGTNGVYLADFGFSSGGDTLLPDENGVYRVRGLKSTHQKVEITASGYAKSVVDISPKSGEDLDIGMITLNKGATLRGRVVDAQGQAISGVQLFRRKGGSGGVFVVGLGGNFVGTPDATSNENGEFTLEGLEVGSHSLKITHSDFAEASETVKVEEGRDPAYLNVTLYMGGSVRGSTSLPNVDKVEGDISVGGDFVALLNNEDTGNTAFGGSESYAASQSKWKSSFNSDGSFLIEKVPAGTYRLFATYRGRSAAVDKVIVVDGKETMVSFEFAQDGSVSGTITMSDGSPYANKTVTLKVNSSISFGQGNPKVTSDAAGGYRFDTVPAGEYLVLIEGDPTYLFGDAKAQRLVTVGDGEDAIKNIDLSDTSGSVINGRVTLGNKAVFTNVSISSPSGGSKHGSVDGAGNFSFNQVEPGDYYLWFNAGHNGSKVGRALLQVPENAEAEIDFVKNFEEGKLDGIVTKIGDIELSQVSVKARPIMDAPFGRDNFAGYMTAHTTANTQGNFALALPIGEYEITVTHPDFAPNSKRVMIQTQSVEHFQIGEEGGKLRIEIKELLKDGKPYTPSSMSYAQLLMRDTAGNLVTMPTGTNYIFLNTSKLTHDVPSLPAGTYTLEIRSSIFELHSFQFTVQSGETTTQDVRLYYGARVTVNLKGEGLDAEALAATKSEIYDSNGKRIFIGNGSASALGSTSAARKFAPFAAGSYKIVLKVPGFENHEEHVTLARGQNMEVTVNLLAKSE